MSSGGCRGRSGGDGCRWGSDGGRCRGRDGARIHCAGFANWFGPAAVATLAGIKRRRLLPSNEGLKIAVVTVVVLPIVTA